MTITTDNAIAKEGFSANYTIRERSLPPDNEDEGEGAEEERGGVGARGDSGHLEEAVPLCFWIFPGCLGRMFPFLNELRIQKRMCSIQTHRSEKHL